MGVQAAVLLAAGRGERMWPFADVRNKAAMPVGNTPNVRRLADSLHRIGVRRIAVVLGWQSGSVRHALLGCEGVVFVDAPQGGGTAGAALAGANVLPDERFLVIYGDTVVHDDDLRAVAEAQEDAGVPGAALWDRLPIGEGSDWHCAEVENGRLRCIVGHESDALTRWLGVVAADRSLLPLLEANPGYLRRVPVGGMPPSEADLAQSLNDWPAEIAAIEASHPVVDMDKPWHVLQANALVAEQAAGALTAHAIHPTARIHDGAQIDGFVQLGPGSEIGNRVVVRGNLVVGSGTRIVNGAILAGHSVVGDRCRISDYAFVEARSTIGNDCIVGHGAEMDGTLFDGAYLWHYCEICGLVGLSVDIGAATVCGTLRFDDGRAEHRVRGRRERPLVEANATYFGDYSRTGVNVITQPGAKIGGYACVGPGVIVQGDVPSRTLRLVRQETIDRPWGPERYGW